ncbi:MAG: CoA transferase, partial [Gammaproteobacteria bacterium]|nr:CoA transferase [Gammaproteobacteria bacterium]
MAPLARFRVVELGVGPVTGLATMVLADFGADVVKVVPKGGDPFAAMGSWPLWTRGKRIVEAALDDPDDLSALRSLIVDSTDAVLTTLNRAERDAIGLDPVSLGRPDLV